MLVVSETGCLGSGLGAISSVVPTRACRFAEISSAKPKIANYHFTTIDPNLGVVQLHDTSFVMADIAGIIEGASEGLGLGFKFLKHIERTKMLIHVVDVSGSEGRDPKEDFDKINEQLFLDAQNANRFANILMPIMGNLGYVLYVAVAVIGGEYVLIAFGVNDAMNPFMTHFGEAFADAEILFNEAVAPAYEKLGWTELRTQLYTEAGLN